MSEKTFRKSIAHRYGISFPSILDLDDYCRLMKMQRLKTISSLRLYCFGLLILPFTFLVLGAQDLAGGEDPETFFSEARRTMIERDIAARGIKDQRLLQVMGTLPRHLFVPQEMRSFAYQDRPLPIGAGQTISQPYIVAFMTELLELEGRERVLEIGTGSGYQTAVLAALAEQVFSVEILPDLSARAQKLLKQLSIQNIKLKVGNGFHGWAEEAPFDAIMITAAAPKIPPPLWNQLSDGGVLIMPLGTAGRTQQLIRARKISGRQVIEEHSAVIFVPMTGGTQQSGSR
ncbi:MAG TPA: protein-L-isoaspartate(D-aspartate) O-methyltransferase [Candidatus Binatia bacterium]